MAPTYGCAAGVGGCYTGVTMDRMGPLPGRWPRRRGLGMDQPTGRTRRGPGSRLRGSEPITEPVTTWPDIGMGQTILETVAFPPEAGER